MAKEYALKATTGGYDIVRGKANAKAGTVRSISGTEDVQTSLNYLVPKTSKSYTMLGNNFVITQQDRSLRYHSTSIDDLRFENIASLTEIIQMGFNYPNEPVVHSTAMHEFYVYDMKLVPKTSLKGIKFNGGSLQYAHSYSYPYWEELSKHNVPALSKTIADALGKTLTLY